ncbi:hypothetical protein C8J57DRAFT_1247210 [Mycena rebaudengoi]|nr:hypothetical protein C8J57DRAFT_1247210 [Mycena rebaudengoi]
MVALRCTRYPTPGFGKRSDASMTNHGDAALAESVKRCLIVELWRRSHGEVQKCLRVLEVTQGGGVHSVARDLPNSQLPVLAPTDDDSVNHKRSGPVHRQSYIKKKKSYCYGAPDVESGSHKRHRAAHVSGIIQERLGDDSFYIFGKSGLQSGFSFSYRVLVEVGSRVALAVILHGLMLGPKSVKVKFLRKRKKLESVIADGMLSKLCIPGRCDGGNTARKIMWRRDTQRQVLLIALDPEWRRDGKNRGTAFTQTDHGDPMV